ncbi:hypothetical protein J2TS6_54590 [Paenibacillus albilobatus]|uniref:Uncharacterized protein n=1 Tax=Paenibacillus albilobatus TaxID=2716884 RepID=A0A920CDZ8_9BACL|nr:hypothetical protein J2TS6_54590 [Paenibacillus albilobatus]
MIELLHSRQDLKNQWLRPNNMGRSHWFYIKIGLYPSPLCTGDIATLNKPTQSGLDGLVVLFRDRGITFVAEQVVASFSERPPRINKTGQLAGFIDPVAIANPKNYSSSSMASGLKDS